jgi:lipoate---protein ligase
VGTERLSKPGDLGTRWQVLHESGPAEVLFAESSAMGFTNRTVRVLTVSAPTVVLGSSQALDLVDHAYCSAKGIDVIKRRSGGGAVWLDHEMVWVDLFIPVDDRLWSNDVGQAMWWVGEMWERALIHSGIDGQVYRGPLIKTPWSSLVCFAGLGPGEVTVDGKKVVGISQRRTRTGALFQCGMLRSWLPSQLLRALTISDRVNGELDACGHGVAKSSDEIADTFLASLNDL